MLLTSSDTKRTLHDAIILIYKFRPNRTGFNMYAEYTRPQLTFLALHPWDNLSTVELKGFEAFCRDRFIT